MQFADGGRPHPSHSEPPFGLTKKAAAFSIAALVKRDCHQRL
jgi:hypothetical protein